MVTINIVNVSLLITGLFIVNIIIALSIIFLERKNPSATLAWIMILFLIPLLGIVFYFLFSQNIARQKIFKMNKYEATVLREALEDQIGSMKNGTYSFTNDVSKKWNHMIFLNQLNAYAFFTETNKISILHDGQYMMQRLMDDINHATDSIQIMYYIIKNDETGKVLLDALTEKAKQGVRIRLLLDSLGSRQITNRRLEAFKYAGGDYAFFFPPKFKFLNMKLNYRNHRKLVVIDGKIGYLGGFNIGNEYLGKVKKFGYWRDTHIRITGAGVQDLFARFILDWRFAAKENIIMTEAYYNQPKNAGNTGLQIVSCGPDSQKEEIKHGYLKMISAAKKNIFIQTPYFVPDNSIIDALKTAILSGVDVRIMIPCKPDHMFVYWATYSYVGILLEIGAKIYVYNPGFLHAKTITVDGEVASVGSANFDIRSFRLNFEVNAFIYDPEVTLELEKLFKNDMDKCTNLTEHSYKNRSLFIKFKESISRLLSDLL